MYCRLCGNSIPDDSLFCKYCGTKQEPSVSLSINNQKTMYLDNVVISPRGPRETKKDPGFLSTERIGRWINIYFCLRDKDYLLTSANGEFFLAILEKDKIIGQAEIDTLIKGSKDVFFSKIKSKSQFSYTNPVSQDMFEIDTIGNLSFNYYVNKFVYLTSTDNYWKREAPIDMHQIHFAFKPSGGGWIIW